MLAQRRVAIWDPHPDPQPRANLYHHNFLSWLLSPTLSSMQTSPPCFKSLGDLKFKNQLPDIRPMSARRHWANVGNATLGQCPQGGIGPTWATQHWAKVGKPTLSRHRQAGWQNIDSIFKWLFHVTVPTFCVIKMKISINEIYLAATLK